MNSNSKTPLFLMEVVIMLLVFAISGAICLKVFVEGKNISEESYDLDKACMEAQKAAEYWQNTKGDIKETAYLLQAEQNGNELVRYYDEEWNITEEEGAFTLSMQTEDTTTKIVITDGEKEILSMNAEAVIFGD